MEHRQLNWPNIWDFISTGMGPGSVAMNGKVSHGDDVPITHVTRLPEESQQTKLIGLIMFKTSTGWSEKYYYMPISDKRQEIMEEIQTILDLLRAGGVAVAEEVNIDLGELE